jgi:hypothetical protein
MRSGRERALQSGLLQLIKANFEPNWIVCQIPIPRLNSLLNALTTTFDLFPILHRPTMNPTPRPRHPCFTFLRRQILCQITCQSLVTLCLAYPNDWCTMDFSPIDQKETMQRTQTDRLTVLRMKKQMNDTVSFMGLDHTVIELPEKFTTPFKQDNPVALQTLVSVLARTR